MGYLLWIKNEEVDEVRMFYSKPYQGYYAGDGVNLSVKEYDDYGHEHSEDYVYMSHWCDVSAAQGSRESIGLIEFDFIYDCILQGTKLEPNVPTEFGLIK